MTRPPIRPEPFPLAKDLRESQVGDTTPLWVKKMMLRQRLMRRDMQRMSADMKALSQWQGHMHAAFLDFRQDISGRMDIHDERVAQRLRVKDHAITALKNLPLVLGVLSIMFPHLKPIFEAIAKGLGAP